MSGGDRASRGACLGLGSRCRRRGRVSEWSRGRWERDPALGWVLLPVALRAAHLAACRGCLTRAGAEHDCTCPRQKKGFQRGESDDLGLTISSERGTGRESSSGWLGQHPCLCPAPARAGLPLFASSCARCDPHRGLSPAPSARDACPGSPCTRTALLETSFPCPSLAFVCLPPLRSAACQGRVTKGWVARNDSGPI